MYLKKTPRNPHKNNRKTTLTRNTVLTLLKSNLTKENLHSFTYHHSKTLYTHILQWSLQGSSPTTLGQRFVSPVDHLQSTKHWFLRTFWMGAGYFLKLTWDSELALAQGSLWVCGSLEMPVWRDSPQQSCNQSTALSSPALPHAHHCSNSSAHGIPKSTLSKHQILIKQEDNSFLD